jgi:hypothetical protein
MEIDLPEILAEVTTLCDAYETALVGNDVSVLDALFWVSPRTLRFGATENLYGYAAIQAFRASRPLAGLARAVRRREITTFGRDLAMAHVEFQRAGDFRIGRQSQTWVRMAEGWRIVAAHVSLLEPH